MLKKKECVGKFTRRDSFVLGLCQFVGGDEKLPAFQKNNMRGTRNGDNNNSNNNDDGS